LRHPQPAEPTRRTQGRLRARAAEGCSGRPLLIGVGNDFARDDAAGRLVARGLAGAVGFDVVESHGAAADLVTAFEGRGRVVLVDACRSGAAPGTLHRFDACHDALPGFLRSVSSHAIGLAEAVALARALEMLPASCTIIAIEGADFSQGTGVTPAVGAVVRHLIETLPSELR
jgi:hydrogenase maturation protease